MAHSIIVGMLLTCVGGARWIALPAWSTQEPSSTAASPADGASLQETVVVPSFSSPLPEGKNVVWTATFQVSWDRLGALFKEPLSIGGAEEISRLLNRSTFQEDQVPVGSGYAIAGSVEEGILGTIKKDMDRLFPDAHPTLEQASSGWVAYSYLRAAVKFEFRFQDDYLEFKDSKGKSTNVTAFGLFERDNWKHPRVRDRVDILFNESEKGVSRAFAVDPCSVSKSVQLILAKIPKKGSFEETWREVEKKISNAVKGPESTLSGIDTFVCPNITVATTHHFKELEGKKLISSSSKDNTKRIVSAWQSIHFALDREGAQVESESMIRILPLPKALLLDGPFLVILRKRDGGIPFFAMWVDNPELMLPLK